MPNRKNRKPSAKAVTAPPKIEKFVQLEPMGYAVIGLTRGGSPMVWPLYHVDVHVVNPDKSRHVLSSYQKGDALNGQYYDDGVGSQLASIAGTAISTLSELSRQRKLVASKKGSNR